MLKEQLHEQFNKKVVFLQRPQRKLFISHQEVTYKEQDDGAIDEQSIKFKSLIEYELEPSEPMEDFKVLSYKDEGPKLDKVAPVLNEKL